MPKDASQSVSSATTAAVPLPAAVMRNRFVRIALPMVPQAQDCSTFIVAIWVVTLVSKQLVLICLRDISALGRSVRICNAKINIAKVNNPLQSSNRLADTVACEDGKGNQYAFCCCSVM
jgi:hypothetical protein